MVGLRTRRAADEVAPEGPPVTAGGPAGGTGVPHVPVMAARVTHLLAVPDRPAVIVDATVGAGGHAAAVLAASGPHVRLVGLDRDARALDLARLRLEPFADRVRLVHTGYEDLARVAAAATAVHGPLLGVLYDLGVSSMQLDDADRGFAFRRDARLDMRMDPDGADASAADLVNSLETGELADLIRRYGEERHARRIARAIVAARPVTTTGELADVVRGAVPAAERHGRTHPATRTFQALRIVVNAELDRLRASLPQALAAIEPAFTAPSGAASRGGRVVVLSYHSLEDRIAKQVFADARRGCICPPGLPVCACGRQAWVADLTRGAERPDDAEVRGNPRARPAKLRAVEKTAPSPA